MADLEKLISGETTFYAIYKRQQARAEKLNNIVPISTPFLDLIKENQMAKKPKPTQTKATTSPKPTYSTRKPRKGID